MKKILVVDNDPVLLRLLTHFLEKKGHQVLTAEDGLSALDILESYVPEVIFIDAVELFVHNTDVSISRMKI